MQEFFYKIMEDGMTCITRYKGNEPEVFIPDSYGAGITALYDELFKGHSEITAVHIPDTVTDIGEFVFDGCSSLRHITLPSQLTTFWGQTFARCGLEEIVLPDNITSLPPFAFKDCKNLRKVICGAGMKKIYAWAFGGCDQLTEVIYNSEVEVSPEAFVSKMLNS